MSDEKDIIEEEQNMTTSVDEAEKEEADFDLNDYMEQYKTLAVELEQAKTAQEENEGRLLRLQADFDNYRRRQREQSENLVRNAASGLVETLLPVVDNFERALGVMAASPDKEGIEMIARQLTQVLQNAGLEEIEALGEQFDPNFHQAVAQAEVKKADKGKVTAVLQKGYTFNGKLLRPAMVQVGI